MNIQKNIKNPLSQFYLAMRYHILTILFFFSTIVSLSAQHTITITPEDTIHLDIDTWHGDLQWQLSHDNAVWTDLPDRTSETLKFVPDQFPSYFRVQITDGNCAPHYSEIVKIIELSPPTIATVTTTTPKNITETTAETGGEITNTGGSSITARGVVYGTSSAPTLSDMFSSDGTGDGAFITLLTGLTSNTTYYVRAYATNSAGTAYGEEHSFKTNEETISIPTVTTVIPHNLGMLNAETGGEITNTGGSSITARGVVFSTSPAPTLGDISSSDGTGGGSFVTFLMTLTANTTYYVRAYATNSSGTGYGEEYSFTTLPLVIYSIGDEGPAGGIIFYDKGSYSNGWRYLETAPKGWYDGANDPWFDLEWGCYEITVGGTSTDIGTGKENTIRILANGCAEADNPVRLAADATINDYTDWFLPSRDEVHELYHNLNNLGANFHSTFGYLLLSYTSSSELDDISAWGIDFGTGSNVQHLKKIATIAARPVRRF